MQTMCVQLSSHSQTECDTMNVLHSEESSEAEGSQKWRKSSLPANIKYGKTHFLTVLGGSCSTYSFLSNLDVICDL